MISWLRSITLSLSQWLILTLAAIIGALVVALRLRGGQLHKAQVDLLASQIERGNEKDQESLQRAREAYETALRAYEEGK